MKSLKKSLIAFCIGATAMGSLAAIASEAKMVMININKNNDDNAVVDLKIDGDSDMFTLPDLQVGETSTFTSKSGKTIITTKTENGYVVDVDGKEIKIPLFEGKLGAKLHKSLPIHQMNHDAINVSGVELDETQQQIIKDAFAAAGIDKKVNFNNHKIMMISTGDISLDGNHKSFEWFSKDGDVDVVIDGKSGKQTKILKKTLEELKKDGKFNIVIDGDGEAGAHVIHKVIEIKEVEEDEEN